MKKYFFVSILFLFIITAVVGAWYYSRYSVRNIALSPPTAPQNPTRLKNLEYHAQQLRSYTAANGFNDKYAFLIDMSIESGKDRFFIVDLTNDSIINSALVTHGRCNEDWLNGRKYSNVVGSGCTSLGRYKIGASYNGKFGLAYKLHGLDTSNSNAFKRFVVLHSHSCVPNQPTHPIPICQSDGCPTVSPEFLQKLKTMIDSSKKSLLLCIYE